MERAKNQSLLMPLIWRDYLQYIFSLKHCSLSLCDSEPGVTFPNKFYHPETIGINLL